MHVRIPTITGWGPRLGSRHDTPRGAVNPSPPTVRAQRKLGKGHGRNGISGYPATHITASRISAKKNSPPCLHVLISHTFSQIRLLDPKTCSLLFCPQCRIAQDSCGHVPARTKSKRSQLKLPKKQNQQNHPKTTKTKPQKRAKKKNCALSAFAAAPLAAAARRSATA